MSKEQGGRSSIHDVARHAGVSAATVSKFLRGARTIKAGNVERIKAAIAELDYRMDPLAADLRRSKRMILGLIVPDLENEFFGALASRLELLAETEGFSLSIASSHESEEREAALVDRMNDWRVAGTVLAPVRSEGGAGATRMRETQMTGILLDRVLSDQVYDTVSVDNAGASAAVCEKLHELGHQNVLLLAHGGVSKNVRARVSGFCETAALIAPKMRIDTLIVGAGDEALRHKLASHLTNEKPTAVYSLFQRGTLMALSEFRRLGLRCPEDVSLIGFDDADWMQVTYPSISAVVQPVDKLAQSTFDLLKARIDQTASKVISHRETCTISMRESLARAPLKENIAG